METLIQQIIHIDRLLTQERDETERAAKVALLRQIIRRKASPWTRLCNRLAELVVCRFQIPPSA